MIILHNFKKNDIIKVAESEIFKFDIDMFDRIFSKIIDLNKRAYKLRDMYDKAIHITEKEFTIKMENCGATYIPSALQAIILQYITVVTDNLSNSHINNLPL